MNMSEMIRSITFELDPQRPGTLNVFMHPVKIIVDEKVCAEHNIPLGRARLEAARRRGMVCIMDNPVMATADKKIETVEYEESPPVNRGERRGGVKQPCKCWQQTNQGGIRK